MSKHTPGPWSVGMGDLVVGPNGQHIADCERTPHDKRPAPPEPECMANARLIAAAPTMLEVLQQIVASGVLQPTPPDTYNHLEREARAAINQAKGA